MKPGLIACYALNNILEDQVTRRARKQMGYRINKVKIKNENPKTRIVSKGKRERFSAESDASFIKSIENKVQSLTGFKIEEFEFLYHMSKLDLSKSRNGVIKSKGKKFCNSKRLFIVLQFYRHNTSYMELAEMYDTSKPYIFLEINTVTDILYRFNFTFRFPGHYEYTSNGCTGAIDCTSHRRDRVHPGQSYLYRSDKGFHFLTTQIVCGLDSFVYSINIGKGSNNDKKMYILTEMESILSRHGIRLFADQGYGGSRQLKISYNSEDCSFRVVVENIFSRVSNFKAAVERSKRNIPLQVKIIHNIFHNVNIKRYFQLGKRDRLRAVYAQWLETQPSL